MTTYRPYPLLPAEDLHAEVTLSDRLLALRGDQTAREIAEARARQRRFLGRALGGRVVVALNPRLHPAEECEALWPERRAG